MRFSVQGATAEQVQAAGATDIKQAPSLKIIFATLTDAQVNQLKALGCKIVPVAKVTTGQVKPPPEPSAEPLYPSAFITKVARFDAWVGIYEPPLKGEGLVVAIIDTGIRESHELINGKVVYSENFTADPMRDDFSHGTAVASLLLAQAPEVSILNLKVMDSDGEGTTEAVILAIDRCLELWDSKSDIAPIAINLSLGTTDTGDPDELLRVACREATDRGIGINAACGNDGPDPGTITSPACEKYVFATGCAKLVSVDGNKYGFQVSEFSSRGPTLEGLVKPDLVFFGEDIICASSQSDTATEPKSGTSFASPFVTGIAVLYVESYLRNYSDWLELLKQAVPGVPVEKLRPPQDPVTFKEIIDYYLQFITVNPGGTDSPKTNDYGYGLLFGDRIAQTAGISEGVELPMELLNSMVSVMVIMGMMGVMMKTIGKKPSPVKR